METISIDVSLYCCREKKGKEEKARHRHSVEISSSNYLLAQHSSVLPVALEETWTTPAAAAMATAPGAPAAAAKVAEGSPSSSSTSAVQSKTVDPLLPTLRLLVELWEKLGEHCLEVIRTEPVLVAVKEEHAGKTSSPSTSANKSAAVREARDNQQQHQQHQQQHHQYQQHQLQHLDAKERKRKVRRGSIRQDSNCELCGGVFPVPVTQHMRQAHPGCHKPVSGIISPHFSQPLNYTLHSTQPDLICSLLLMKIISIFTNSFYNVCFK